MSARDRVIGMAKQAVAEIVGDGGLAEEGTRQAAEGSDRNTPSSGSPSPQPIAPAQPAPAPRQPASVSDQNALAALLGHAILRVWADLPRDTQERLFAAAVDDGVIANELAELLHDRHPRTTHQKQSG